MASKNAGLVDFRISLRFNSKPAMNIKKNTATFARMVMESSGERIAKSDGPKITPANNSPTREGCFIRRNNSPSIRATARESTSVKSKCSICN